MQPFLGPPDIPDTTRIVDLDHLETDLLIALIERRIIVMVIDVDHLQKRDRIRQVFHQAEMDSGISCDGSRHGVPRLS